MKSNMSRSILMCVALFQRGGTRTGRGQNRDRTFSLEQYERFGSLVIEHPAVPCSQLNIRLQSVAQLNGSGSSKVPPPRAGE